MCQTYGAVRFSSDSVTKREELLSFASKAEVIEFARSITDEVNKRWQGKGTPWVFLLDDPGYATNKKSEAEGENKHLGIHVLMNRQAKRGQKPHIDGIGSPFQEEIPRNLEDFQGPLSVAFFLTESKDTQFGENIKLANMFYEMLDGEKSPKDLCDEVSLVLQRNEEFFDAEIVPMVSEGTCHVFPKNLKVHRGTARGPSNDLDDMRVVIYFTLCRQGQFQKYVNDKMETAELSPGFNNGKFGKANLEIWAQQWLVAHQHQIRLYQAAQCEACSKPQAPNEFEANEFESVETDCEGTNLGKRRSVRLRFPTMMFIQGMPDPALCK